MRLGMGLLVAWLERVRVKQPDSRAVTPALESWGWADVEVVEKVAVS